MQSEHPVAHPLATALAQTATQGRFLLVGIGSGRNLLPFSDTEIECVVVDENPARLADAPIAQPRVERKTAVYSALPIASGTITLALATHVLQHGTLAEIRGVVAELARVCAVGARFFGVAASRGDARYGHGTRVEPHCFAAETGEERGVAHYFFDERQLRNVLADTFEITELREVSADATVGAWAHAAPRGLRHFFFKTIRR